MPNRPPPLTVSERALEKIHALLEKRGKPSEGIRIGIRTKGCNGLAYTLEYVDNVEPLDEKVECGKTTIYIDPKAILFLLGTEMDYEDHTVESGFTFHNPNEKGRCGCGESFHV